MPNERTYLDYNATAPLLDAARTAMTDALSMPGNASSVHKEGRKARQLIEEARRSVAASTGATAANVIFTSGATEAATHALSPVIRAGGRNLPVSKLYVSAVEHSCVLSGGRFVPKNVVILPVDGNGILDIEALETALGSHDHDQGHAMVAVQYANSETGVIQPLDAISQVVHRHGAFFTVDAVQALGKVDLDLAATGAHFMLVSSHKIGGPQGVGALILRDGSISPEPVFAGSQENYHRGGTENLAAIAGFGAACDWHRANGAARVELSRLRDVVESEICTISMGNDAAISTPVFAGSEVSRLPNTSCILTRGLSAETTLIALDLGGIAVSSGSACSSGKVGSSHVLEAMGVSADLSASAIRVTVGWQSKTADVERFSQSFLTIMKNAA